MKTRLFSLTVIFVLATLSVYCQKKPKPTMVLIETSLGNIKIKLYDETPKHRDNFIKLVNDKYYEGVLFHRVIKDFMIQAGDPNSKNAAKDAQLGSGGPDYTIPAEFNTNLYHKKGALSAARTGDEMNPNRESSGSQFYIVQGQIYSSDDLNKMEENANMQVQNTRIRTYINAPENDGIKKQLIDMRNKGLNQTFDSLVTEISKKLDEQFKAVPKFKFTDEQRKVYSTIGGTPFLDGAYTVFGEVLEGIEVVDKIAAVKTLPGDRPEVDVVVKKMTIVTK